MCSNAMTTYKQILSNEATRAQYDRELRLQKDTGRQHSGKWNYSTEFEDGVRIYKWAEVRQKMQRERYWERYNFNEESSSYGKTDGATEEGEQSRREVPSVKCLDQPSYLLFLLQTFGSRLSLTLAA